MGCSKRPRVKRRLLIMCMSKQMTWMKEDRNASMAIDVFRLILRDTTKTGDRVQANEDLEIGE